MARLGWARLRNGAAKYIIYIKKKDKVLQVPLHCAFTFFSSRLPGCGLSTETKTSRSSQHGQRMQSSRCHKHHIFCALSKRTKAKQVERVGMESARLLNIRYKCLIFCCILLSEQKRILLPENYDLSGYSGACSNKNSNHIKFTVYTSVVTKLVGCSHSSFGDIDVHKDRHVYID